MQKLWIILAILTLARMTMGFQFQSIAAVGPVLTAESLVSYSELGVLIGIYLLPGALFAIPGGWLGKRFGDKPVVLSGLAMMTLGGLLMALSESYPGMAAGRLISGLGAVLLNVLVTKMVADWFSEQRIATAMGILISSWPLGIAIALVTLGPLQDLIGLKLTFFVPVALCAIAWVLIASIYSNPPESGEEVKLPSGSSQGGMSAFEVRGIVLAGCVWCLYNVAFILSLSFGPEYLVSQGLELVAAGAIVSLASWIVIPALPLGAWAAERTGRPLTMISVTFIGTAILIWMIPVTSFYIALFLLLGIVFAPAGGLIMALPSSVLRKENRAVGMGIFFSIYYAGMGIFPALAGYSRDVTGNPAAPLVLAGGAILLGLLALAGYRANQVSQVDRIADDRSTKK